MERTDFSYNDRAAGRDGYRLKGDTLPSDVFRSNCFADFQEDVLGIKHRDIIGVDNIMWGSDYPHSEGTWPKSREFIEETLAECTEGGAGQAGRRKRRQDIRYLEDRGQALVLDTSYSGDVDVAEAPNTEGLR